MTNEEKQLLLKDLCARLPYGVKVLLDNINNEGTINGVGLNSVYILEYHEWWDIEFVKPYLRPLSSITNEERKVWQARALMRPRTVFADKLDCLIDWLNAHHFDYRGLIPMGLALEATEDIYKID